MRFSCLRTFYRGLKVVGIWTKGAFLYETIRVNPVQKREKTPL